MIKLCTMSETGEHQSPHQQCKAYCITHIPITLSVQSIGIRKAHLHAGALHTEWSTCPRWWALSVVSKLALSSQPKASQKKISSSDFCGILCICRKTCQKSPYNLISVFLAFSKSLLLDYHNILFQIHVQNKENFHAVNACSFIKGCFLCRKKPSTSILSNYKSRWYH